MNKWLMGLLPTSLFAGLLIWGIKHDIDYPKLNGWSFEENVVASLIVLTILYSLSVYGWKHR